MARFFIFILSFLFFNAQSGAQHTLQQFQSQIDSLIKVGIDSAAFPGCQLLVIHKGNHLIDTTYGHHTYERITRVEKHHLYDLASVTKVMAGGLALMKLEEKGLFSPEEKLSETHPYFRNSNKQDLTWQEILAHQSGMQSYIVFWQTAKNKKGNFKWRTFSFTENRWNTISIDDEIFLHRRYPKRMLKLIKESTIKEEKKYLYSGMGFLLIPDLVYRRSDKCLDEFLKEEIYQPLGLDRITFRPSLKFPLDEIVPTEVDTFFRNKLVHGHVHDENASMLNGVSANAGLFSNATSLGKISQMLITDDNQIISSSVIKKYNSVQFPENDNRRGLVFDKPPFEYEEGSSYIARSASPSSFGHSGFTGTFFWIDPEDELIVIFLSNRVHPYRSNTKLYTMNLRPKIHQAAYDYVHSLKE